MKRKKKMHKIFRTAVVVVAAALALAGCGSSAKVSQPVSGSWADIVAAANKEGSVTLYSTQAQAVLDNLKKAFESAYPGIKVTVVRGIDSELLPRIGAEQKTHRGIGDVAVTTDEAWIHANENSDTAVAVHGPSFDDPAYRRREAIIGGKFFTESAILFGFGWNTSLYPKGIDSAEDLLDPALRGKVGIVTPATSPTYIDYYDFIEKHYGGSDFLQKLAANKPRIYPSTQPLSQAMASGEITAALMCNPMLPERAAGAPVGWNAGKYAWGAKWYGLTLGTAPHPNAAQVLADFMVTKAGQQATSPGYGAALPGIDGALALAQDVPAQNLAVTVGTGAEKFRNDWESIFR